jgi:hypothetical protein
MLIDEREPGASEGRPVVGKGVSAKAGEDAESTVQQMDQRMRGHVHRPRRDAEVRDQPEGARRSVPGKPVCESLYVRLGEAVEKKVSDDEIVNAGGLESERVRAVSDDATLVLPGPLDELPQHGAAAVDRLRMQGMVRGEQIREEAAIAVAERKRTASIRQSRQEAVAATLQRASKR